MRYIRKSKASTGAHTEQKTHIIRDSKRTMCNLRIGKDWIELQETTSLKCIYCQQQYNRFNLVK